MDKYIFLAKDCKGKVAFFSAKEDAPDIGNLSPVGAYNRECRILDHLHTAFGVYYKLRIGKFDIMLIREMYTMFFNMVRTINLLHKAGQDENMALMITFRDILIDIDLYMTNGDATIDQQQDYVNWVIDEIKKI